MRIYTKRIFVFLIFCIFCFSICDILYVNHTGEGIIYFEPNRANVLFILWWAFAAAILLSGLFLIYDLIWKKKLKIKDLVETLLQIMGKERFSVIAEGQPDWSALNSLLIVITPAEAFFVVKTLESRGFRIPHGPNGSALYHLRHKANEGELIVLHNSVELRAFRILDLRTFHDIAREFGKDPADMSEKSIDIIIRIMKAMNVPIVLDRDLREAVESTQRSLDNYQNGLKEKRAAISKETLRVEELISEGLAHKHMLTKVGNVLKRIDPVSAQKRKPQKEEEE